MHYVQYIQYTLFINIFQQLIKNKSKNINVYEI